MRAKLAVAVFLVVVLSLPNVAMAQQTTVSVSTTTITPPIPECDGMSPQDAEQADFGAVTTSYNGGDIEALFVACGQPYTYGQIRVVVEFAWVNKGEWEVNGTTVSFTFDGARHYISPSCNLGYADYAFSLNLTHQGGYYDPTLKRVLPTVYAGQGDVCFQHHGTYSPAFIVDVPNLGSFRIYQNMRVPYALTITDAPTTTQSIAQTQTSATIDPYAWFDENPAVKLIVSVFGSILNFAVIVTIIVIAIWKRRFIEEIAGAIHLRKPPRDSPEQTPAQEQDKHDEE